jgi:hypothetical protein
MDGACNGDCGSCAPRATPRFDGPQVLHRQLKKPCVTGSGPGHPSGGTRGQTVGLTVECTRARARPRGETTAVQWPSLKTSERRDHSWHPPTPMATAADPRRRAWRFVCAVSGRSVLAIRRTVCPFYKQESFHGVGIACGTAGAANGTDAAAGNLPQKVAPCTSCTRRLGPVVPP